MSPDGDHTATAALVAELSTALGPGGCLTGDAIGAACHTDATGTGRHAPLALLRPTTTAEVSAVLAICCRHGVGVVPQGGLTGLAGGACPQPDQVALSLSRLSGVEEIDAASGVMVLRAGTVLEVAQQAAEAAGFLLPIDLGARGSCQIGGNIATNAGGLRVIRHGNTRDNVLGLEVVLADGTVLSHLTRVKKDNTGYALHQLFIGSEGTLGVITRAVLRLVSMPAPVGTALCALDSYDKVLHLLARARAEAAISAFEVMWRDYMELARGQQLFADLPAFSVIVEMDETRLEPFLEAAFADGLIADALIAQSHADARRFWDVRDGQTVPADLGLQVWMDVSIPLAQADAFVCACQSDIIAVFPRARTGFYGHLGDSNLHITIALPDGDAADAHKVEAITYDLVRAMAGSISAEHGVGTEKRAWLDHSRSPAELSAMRAIKAALDPKGLMNPGKVL